MEATNQIGMGNLATNYYIKAKDSYPFELNEAIEALEYALSYDEEHAGAHCLMGRYYSEHEYNYKEAFYHFERALFYDLEHVETYLYYTLALIEYGEYDKAKKVISYGKKIPGVNLANMIYRRALIHERKGKLYKAKEKLKKAMNVSCSNYNIDFYNDELNRVKEKIRKRNK